MNLDILEQQLLDQLSVWLYDEAGYVDSYSDGYNQAIADSMAEVKIFFEKLRSETK